MFGRSSTAQDIKWPKGGELDILEYANDESNKVTFHTDRMCKLNVALAVFLRFVSFNLFIQNLDASLGGHFVCRRYFFVQSDWNTNQVEKLRKCARNIKGIDPKMIVNCYTNYTSNQLGCMPPQVRKDGECYAKNPGVIALLWDASGITSFHIPESEIPADLNQTLPNQIPGKMHGEWPSCRLMQRHAWTLQDLRRLSSTLQFVVTGQEIHGLLARSAKQLAICLTIVFQDMSLNPQRTAAHSTSPTHQPKRH